LIDDSVLTDADAPMLPDYSGAGLCNVMPSVAASVGASGYDNTLGLPDTERVCVMLIDGLGATGVAGHEADAPTLAALLRGSYADFEVRSRQLTAGFPSTTGASLASIGTGLPPSRHGLVGYRVLIPERGRLMSLLQWDDAVDPAIWQPHPTIFERLAEAGIATAHVASPDFAESGLTRAAFRGARYLGALTPGELIATSAEALREADARIVFSYYPDLDKTGHGHGVDSAAWRHQLAVVDRMVERLIAELPPGTTLVITADHGMVDVEPDEKLDLEATTLFDGMALPDGMALLDGVALLGGEARARHVYTKPGAAPDVLAAWRHQLADQAWVVSREQAIDQNWFGPAMRADVVARVGDVVAAARAHAALVATSAEPRQSVLRGMHGSLTPAEQLVPLVTVQR